MNKNLKIYYQTALDLKLRVSYVPEIDGLEILLGKQSYYFINRYTPLNPGSSIYHMRHKQRTNFILQEAEYQIPQTVLVTKEHFLSNNHHEIIQDLNFPLVAKPVLEIPDNLDVLCDIKDFKELDLYLTKAFETHKTMQIQEFHNGLREYSVLILKNRVIGVIEHKALSVIGNGQQSIEELIAAHNQHIQNKTPFPIDDECLHCLAHQGLELNSILPKRKEIYLTYAANKAHGGMVLSHGNQIHSDNAKILTQTAKKLGLEWVSLDILCKDINLSFNNSSWFIMDTHCAPDILLFELPDTGAPIQVSRKLMLHLISRHIGSYVFDRIKRIFSPSKWKKSHG